MTKNTNTNPATTFVVDANVTRLGSVALTSGRKAIVARAEFVYAVLSHDDVSKGLRVPVTSEHGAAILAGSTVPKSAPTGVVKGKDGVITHVILRTGTDVARYLAISKSTVVGSQRLGYLLAEHGVTTDSRIWALMSYVGDRSGDAFASLVAGKSTLKDFTSALESLLAAKEARKTSNGATGKGTATGASENVGGAGGNENGQATSKAPESTTAPIPVVPNGVKAQYDLTMTLIARLSGHLTPAQHADLTSALAAATVRTSKGRKPAPVTALAS